MNSSELLSIIVPIYNSEKFLNKCIDSILKQRYDNIELILVDDFSSDSSSDICENYSNSDSRVNYYRMNCNKGVSYARNFGLKKANGKYVTFVDSDDFVDKDIYTTTLKKMCDVELVIFDAVDISINNEIQNIQKINLISENKSLLKDKLLPNELFEVAGAVWRNIYVNQIIKENEITFPIDINLSEDRIFNLKYISYVKHFIYISKPLYFRIVHPDSMVHKFKKNMIEETIFSNSFLKDTVNNYWGKNFSQPYNYIFCLSYISCIRNILRKENKECFFLKYKLIKSFLNNKIVEGTFEDCKDLLEFDIYREKKIITILIIQILELCSTKKHNNVLKKIYGKVLCELYKLNGRR
ncbi:glycosyltransferase [Catenibacterium mitsuokai]|uniref:glycosyltransferase n=1 Tax=Catenibacterium mitsuokai TaxID=100886 RepID=UPI003F906ABF